MNIHPKKNTNARSRGIASLGIILAGAAGVAAAGWLFYHYRFQPVVNNPAPVAAASSSPSSSSPFPRPRGGPVLPFGGASTTSVVLIPSSGAVGISVEVKGEGFSPTNNTVLFNGMTAPSMSGLSSSDGRTLVFTVPEDLGPYCQPGQPCPNFLIMVGLETYTVTVVSPDGTTRNAGTFMVTAAPHAPPVF